MNIPIEGIRPHLDVIDRESILIRGDRDIPRNTHTARKKSTETQPTYDIMVEDRVEPG